MHDLQLLQLTFQKRWRCQCRMSSWALQAMLFNCLLGMSYIFVSCTHRSSNLPSYVSTDKSYKVPDCCCP